MTHSPEGFAALRRAHEWRAAWSAALLSLAAALAAGGFHG